MTFAVDFRLGAISSHDGVGSLHDPGRGPLGFQASAAVGENNVLLIGCDNLINSKIAIGMTPFIFKCDIEGGEERLFSDDVDWFDKFFL